MSKQTCERCSGYGQIVVASHHVGDGCVNDDFDTCPRCRGTGQTDITTTTKGGNA